MIQYIEGNILNSTENIIIQSVNHKGKMNSGLAAQIKKKHPEIAKEGYLYQSMCKTMSFEEIKREGLVAWHYVDDKKFIASVFGQDKYGTDKQHTDYVALGKGLETVKLFAEFDALSVAIPYGIGCGLGGGDWNVVKDIIERCFGDSVIDVWIYRYE